MIVLNSVLLGTFFIGGAIAGAAVVLSAIVAAWCFHWPRGIWK